MIHLNGGPADNVSLPLRRAPVLLRAVRDAKGNWDGLDQLDDEPKPGETIVVYQRIGAAGSIHLCIRGKGRAAGGWYAVAKYRFIEEQPADADVRTTAAWRAWCEAFRIKELAAEPQKAGQ